MSLALLHTHPYFPFSHYINIILSQFGALICYQYLHYAIDIIQCLHNIFNFLHLTILFLLKSLHTYFQFLMFQTTCRTPVTNFSQYSSTNPSTLLITSPVPQHTHLGHLPPSKFHILLSCLD